MNYDYLLAALLLNLTGIAIVFVFGAVWNRSRASITYNTSLSFRMSFVANVLLLPLHLLLDVMLLQAVLG